MTKCGRYGSTASDFDYSPATIRASVQRSLSRLNTDYLDTVYLHDIEFVCTPVGPRVAGDHTVALSDEQAEYGLAEGEEAKVWGEGDRKILDAVAELRKMQEEGSIKSIGITGGYKPLNWSDILLTGIVLHTGYPLPTLLRIALLVLHTPPFKPLDVLLSYSQLTLQNKAFAVFAPHFRTRAGIPQLLTASPLNMGLLTPTPPAWHPAPSELRAAANQANAVCVEARWKGGLPNLAVGYGFKMAREVDAPCVVGMSNLHEVHENMRVWREVEEAKEKTDREACENTVMTVFGNLKGWAWVSPPAE